MEDTNEYIADYLMDLSCNADLNRAALLAASRIIRYIDEEKVVHEYVTALNDINMERYR